jgi:hypothetical protein
MTGVGYQPPEGGLMKRLLIAIPMLMMACYPGRTTVDTTKPAPEPEKKLVCPPMLTRFIQKSNPSLQQDEAEKIAGIIEKVADEHEIDVILFAAVIRQESHFKNGSKACRSINGRRTCDYGIAQINTFWVDEWELDAKKLRNDVEYNVSVAAKILKSVLQKGKGDKYAYSLYNSADPAARAAYQEHIERYRKIAQALRS